MQIVVNRNPTKMTEAETDHILNEVKSLSDKITKYSEEAQLDSFLDCYDNSPTFLHSSGDGRMRNYEDFKKICSEYYTTLKQQQLSTITEKFNVIDTNLVIAGWTGNIVAQLKNGDTINMTHYSVTNIFKKINSDWKIIHSHESSPPPEIIKKR